MSLKSWFGFPVTPENLTPTTELICICLTAATLIFLLVVIVTYKCTQRKTRGRKEAKAAQRNSALSSGETEHESKRSNVDRAEDQIDGKQRKQGVQKAVKEEVKTETVKTKDINADVQQLENENQGKTLNKDLNTDSPEPELPKSDEQLKETSPEPEIQSAKISTPKSNVNKAEDQIDGKQRKQEVQKAVKEEVKTETVKTKDINADVQQLETENQGKTLNKDLNTDNPEPELPKSDEQLKETSPEPEIQSAEISTSKLEKSEWLRYDMLKEMKKTSSQLKLALALSRMVKLEDKVDTFCSGKNQSMENDLDNLKRKLQAKEKELEQYEWLRNELIHGIKSLSQLKLALAITRIQKLEDKVDDLLHGRNQSTEKDLQILQWKLEAKEKELKDKEAAVLKLCEQQNKEDDEKNPQTLKNNSPNTVVNEEMAKGEQRLQGEQQSREDAELTVQKQLQSTNDVLESRVAELERQLQDEQRRREDAEEELKDLKVQVVTKKKKSSLSSDLDGLLKDIETIYAEMVMKENDLQMLKKELETINKRLHQPSANRETMIQTIDELKQTQTQLEERNAEIRNLRKQLDHKLYEEKQRNEKNLESLKKKFEAQNQQFEDKVSEVQQQLKDEQQRRESLMEMNQEFKRQLSELRETHKEELEKKIQLEQQWRKEVDKEVEVLKQELESKRNQLKTAKEDESDVSADEPSVPTEPNEALDTV